MTLKELPIGKSASILSVGGTGALRQHLLDMGLIQGAEVTVIKYAPMGDPIELRIHDYELTIRLEDAGQIEKLKSSLSPSAFWNAIQIYEPNIFANVYVKNSNGFTAQLLAEKLPDFVLERMKELQAQETGE